MDEEREGGDEGSEGAESGNKSVDDDGIASVLVEGEEDGDIEDEGEQVGQHLFMRFQHEKRIRAVFRLLKGVDGCRGRLGLKKPWNQAHLIGQII